MCIKSKLGNFINQAKSEIYLKGLYNLYTTTLSILNTSTTRTVKSVLHFEPTSFPYSPLNQEFP